jgi:putative peptidoglycan lipid II flippase
MTSAPSIEAPPAARRTSGFLRDTCTLSLIAGVVKIAGAGKSIAVARAFGSGPALDNYLLAFLIPSVLADTFCGALVPVTVPRLIELEHRGGFPAVQAFYAKLLGSSVRFSLLGAAALACVIGAALGFANGNAVGWLALLMLPVIPANAVANVWRAVLNSRNQFAAAALTAVFTPAAISLATLVGAPLIGANQGAWVLAAATTLGAFGEMALLGVAMRGTGYPLLPRRERREVAMRSFRKEYGYLAASGALSGGTLALGQAMAAWLGPGSVSALNYGTRLSGVLMSIGPAALGIAVLPRFSRVAAELDWNALKHSLRRLLYGSLAVSAAAAAVFALFSAPIVRLTLQHGAFTAADTGTVATVQAWSLLQMPSVVGISILMRVFSVLLANRVLLPLSAGALAVNLALNYVLMNRYGVAGIALAASLAQTLLFAAMVSLIFGPRAWVLKEAR